MAKDILTFGDAEYYSGRADMQRVYYKDVEVGAIITYKSTLKEYFCSMELRHKTCIAIQGEYKVTKDKLSVETAETNGYYELWLELVDAKKYCDLISLAGKIYKRLRPIVCKQCGKTLFYTDAETDGAAGAFEAKQYCVIYKMPFLYNPKRSLQHFSVIRLATINGLLKIPIRKRKMRQTFFLLSVRKKCRKPLLER